MLNRPRSSLPTTRRMSASRFSARSSGGMSRVPIAAWNVRLSRLRTRIVLRIDVIRFVGSAGDGTRLQGEVPRGKDAHADGLASAPRQHDLLIEAVLGDGKVDFAQVHRDLDGLLELPGLRGLEELLDRLDRMLVRQGESPPAVRAATRASCTEKPAKERALNKALRAPSGSLLHRGGRRRIKDFGITSFAVRQGSTSWLMRRSQAMLASMYASSQGSLAPRARRATPSWVASLAASSSVGALATAIQASVVSTTGRSMRTPRTTSTWARIVPAISSPVTHTSPSAMRAWMSPIASCTPGWKTGK